MTSAAQYFWTETVRKQGTMPRQLFANLARTPTGIVIPAELPAPSLHVQGAEDLRGFGRQGGKALVQGHR